MRRPYQRLMNQIRNSLRKFRYGAKIEDVEYRGVWKTLVKAKQPMKQKMNKSKPHK